MIEYVKYLNSIGINTETLIQKINKTLEAAERICPEKIEDIYISDLTTGEGRRGYDSLYLFTGTYIIECTNFSTDTNITVEMTNLKEKINYVKAKYNDYFKKAINGSILSITFYNNGGAYELSATENNCDKLNEIYDKYIKPNIAKVPIPS